MPNGFRNCILVNNLQNIRLQWNSVNNLDTYRILLVIYWSLLVTFK